MSLGLPVPPSEYAYCPLSDPSLTQEEILEHFGTWVSGYFHYAPHVLSTLTTSDDLHALFLAFSESTVPGADFPQPHLRPTALRMSPEEFSACADTVGAVQAHIPLLAVNPDVYAANTRFSLMEPQAWPRLRIAYIWCDMSFADSLYAVAQVAQMTRSAWPATGAPS